MNTHRATDTDPALSIGSITSAVTAIIALLVALGVPVSEDLKVAIVAAIATLAPIIAALALRPRVTANSSVVERIDRGRVVAGEGSELPTGKDIRAVGSLDLD